MEHTVQDVKAHLLSIHTGTFEPENYLGPWFSSEASTLFIERSMEIKPRSIMSGVGRPRHCHETALETGLMVPRSRPYFGFRLTWTDQGWLWRLHSWLVTPTGSILDPGPDTLEAKYVGVKWSRGFRQCIEKIDWE